MKSSEELVNGRVMYRSLDDFVRASCVYIEIEQRQPTPDSALIALLCDAVRLARETEDHYRSVRVSPDVKKTPE